MGFLSRIFGKSKESKLSYVRTWAKQKERESRYAKNLDPEFYFGAFMYAISGLGQSWEGMTEPEDVPENKLQYADYPYSGDASFFEVACYSYTNVDMWLFQNAPDYRIQFSSFLNQRIVELFAEALSFRNDNLKLTPCDNPILTPL